MTILKHTSIMWSLIHTLIMFLFFFESRYPKKKTMILTLSAMLPLILINLVLFVVLGDEEYLNIMLLTLSLPSFIFFWFLSKNRGFRFIFTFCMVDTIVLEIIYITSIIEYYIPGESYFFVFITRLLAYPLLEWFIYKKFRFIYRDIQNEVKQGWWIFAFIGILFYITMTLAMSYPTMVTERPEDLPVVILMFILMPVSYINIFNTLFHQQMAHNAAEQENILKIQVSDIKSRVEEFAEANNKFRIERHNFRHKMQTIAKMVDNEQYNELRRLVLEYNEAITETKVKRYCDNAVLDAVLSSYLTRAENRGIKVTTAIHFPETLGISDTELATVFANALENAINACEKIDEEKRFIDVKVLDKPKLMFHICNSFNGNIEFNDSGVPITHDDGHGFGTRSIIAFCEKHEVYYEFKTKDDNFILQVMF